INAQQEEASAREKLNAQRATMHEVAEQLTQARRAAQALRAKLSEHRRAQQQRENEFAAQERELAVLQERVRFAESQHTDAKRELENAQAVAQAALTAYETAAANLATPTHDLAQDVVAEPQSAVEVPQVDTEFEAKQRAEAEKIAEAKRTADA